MMKLLALKFLKALWWILFVDVGNFELSMVHNLTSYACYVFILFTFFTMTKRIGSFSDNVSSKRQKTVDDIEDLWGDDLDENAIDDCIKFESQVRLEISEEFYFKSLLRSVYHNLLKSIRFYLRIMGF